jgi:hypothetical protein
MRPNKLITYIFTAVGLSCLVAGLIWYQVTQGFLSSATITEGEIIELRGSRSSEGGTTYRPVVRFKDNTGKDHQFASNFSSSPPHFEPGEWVQVAYDPNDPTKVQIKEFLPLWLGPMILGFLGSIFGIIGLSFLIYPKLKQKRKSHLLRTGRPVPARITEVSLNQSYKVNGRHPFVIHAQWLDPKTASVKLFRSDNFWYDPQPYLHQEEVTVFIDKDNQNRYWMDTSFLPEIAN